MTTCQCDYTGLGHPIMNPALMSGRDAPALMADIYPYPPWAFPLMSGIDQQLPPVQPGAPFQFGFNAGYTSGPFSAADIAPVLEAAGLSYNTRSYLVSGHLNPYIGVEGNANVYYDSGSDFGQDIYNAISGASFPIDYGSVKFHVEPYYPPNYTPPPTPVGNGGSGAGGGASPPGSKTSWLDDLSASLGLKRTETEMLTIGAGFILAIVLLKR